MEQHTCTHEHIHVNVLMHTDTHVHTYMNTDTCWHTHTHTWTHAHIHARIRINACAHTRTDKRVNTHSCTQTHTRSHSLTDTLTHTHTHTFGAGGTRWVRQHLWWSWMGNFSTWNITYPCPSEMLSDPLNYSRTLGSTEDASSCNSLSLQISITGLWDERGSRVRVHANIRESLTLSQTSLFTVHSWIHHSLRWPFFNPYRYRHCEAHNYEAVWIKSQKQNVDLKMVEYWITRVDTNS